MTSPSDALDPARLESAAFDMVRRGFDPTAVRGELQRAAQEIRRLRLERDELAGRLAEYDGVSPNQLEAHQIAEALGAEATQVIQAAHVAAKERAERAEREADAVRDEALAAAEAIRAEVEAAREKLLEDARREAETVTEDGRARGRDMVAEAQTVRERMLRDLARKRQTGRAQVEQLRAGRDRLLESLTIAQKSLDDAVLDLVNSVPEARAAAERAGLRVTAEPLPTPNDLEGEIESARAVGHPLLDDVVDPESVEDAFITGEMEALTDLDVLGDVDPPADEDPDDEQPDNEEVAADGDAVESDPVVLYDVESEGDAVESEGDDVESEGADVEPAVDDVFARLRSSHGTDESEADPDADADHEDDASADQDSASDPEPDPVEGEIDPDRAAARATAADAAAKAMKKILVEEQGTLLDGIRRSGAEAVRFVVDDAAAHGVTYEKAAAPALKDLASALGGSRRLSLTAAFAHIHAIALEPVRQRLADVAERVDDPDELSDTVRALYRESRGRRIPEAAAAAAVAVDGLVAVATADGLLRWNVEPGGPCGPDCADNALAGPLAAGEEYPTGDKHPPAHATCTCWLAAGDPE